MSSARYVRRSLAVLASVGVAAALTLVPTTAQAQVAGQYAAEGQVGADFIGTGSGSCDLTSGSGTNISMSGIRHFSHGTRNASDDVKATFTNSLDTSDQVTVKGHVDSTLTLKRKHRDLSAFELTVGGHISVNHTVTGSDCRGTGEVLGEMAMTFTEHKKGFLEITRDIKKANSLYELVLEEAATGQEVSFDIFQGGHSHIVSRALLKPGTYRIAEGLAGITTPGVGPALKSAPRSSKAAQTIDIHGVFKPQKH